MEGDVAGVRCIRYAPRGGARAETHFLSRTFENAVAHADGVYRTLKARGEPRPDVIVGHSGFGSTALLPELWDAPIVNYFEYWYRTRGEDLEFRPDFPPGEDELLRARMRNAMILLDLQACTAGYTPTRFQHGLFPAEHRGKIEVLHDGIDTEIWHPRPRPSGARIVLGEELPPGTRVVTYAARGFESVRGFDIFMRAARRICSARSDVVFVVVGEDRVCYGGDLSHVKAATFREHVLGEGGYDLSRFRFPGRIPAAALSELLAASDLHVYLTTPFILSWSPLNAMACGAVVLASDTAPVREFVEDGVNGLLTDFHDSEGLSLRALDVLEDPAAFRPLGAAARRTIEERVALDVLLPRHAALLERAAGHSSSSSSSSSSSGV